MTPYGLERIAAQRLADYVREAEADALAGEARRSGRLGAAIAGALRGVADRLDGGRRADGLGTIRVLD